MAAHRYWRVVGIEAYGHSDLEITEFQLLSVVTRVDASATLTASVAPTTGAVVNLKDDDTATGATWSASALSQLTLSWDFGLGGDVDVTDICIGSAVDPAKFMLLCTLQYSDDGVAWAASQALNAITWPGVRAKTSSLDPTGRWSLTDRAQGTVVSEDQYTLTSGYTHPLFQSARGMVAHSSGVRQFEVVMTLLGSGRSFGIGVGTSSASLTDWMGNAAGSYAYNTIAKKFMSGAASDYGATYGTGDVIGVVVDFGVGSLTFYKNGAAQGVASATGMLGLTLFPMAGQTSGFTSGETPTSQVTMRGRGFAYPVAGASEWSGNPVVRRGRVLVRASDAGFSSVASFGATPTPMRAAPVGAERARPNYLFDPKIRGRVRGVVLMHVGGVNKPVHRRVFLIRERDMLLVQQQWSNPITGAYDFQYVEETETYTVLSYDYLQDKRAVVADGISLANGKLELMP